MYIRYRIRSKNNNTEEDPVQHCRKKWRWSFMTFLAEALWSQPCSISDRKKLGNLDLFLFCAKRYVLKNLYKRQRVICPYLLCMELNGLKKYDSSGAERE
jgi:hypothetical protein